MLVDGEQHLDVLSLKQAERTLPGAVNVRGQIGVG